MLPVTTPKSTSENSSASAMRNTFSVKLPNRLLPDSLSSAVAVHENATPIDISSPIYAIVRLVSDAKIQIKIKTPSISSEKFVPLHAERANLLTLSHSSLLDGLRLTADLQPE